MRSPRLRPGLVPGLVVALIVLLQLLGPPLEALRLERHLALEQPWRLLTGQLVHLSWGHAALNAGSLLLFSAFSTRLGGREGVVVLLVGAFAVALGVLLRHPEVDWYVGFSGVAYAVVVAAAWFERRADPRVSVLLTVGLTAKLSADVVFGASAATEALVGGSVLSEAHLYGVLGGLVAVAGLDAVRAWRLARPNAGRERP